jgi:hypothetical protein
MCKYQSTPSQTTTQNSAHVSQIKTAWMQAFDKKIMNPTSVKRVEITCQEKPNGSQSSVVMWWTVDTKNHVVWEDRFSSYGSQVRDADIGSPIGGLRKPIFDENNETSKRWKTENVVKSILIWSAVSAIWAARYWNAQLSKTKQKRESYHLHKYWT